MAKDKDVVESRPKLDRIQSNLASVKSLVKELQNSSGGLTRESQALLDQIEQKLDEVSTDAETFPRQSAPA